jgi:polar amino acid transport system permease protein
LPIKPLRITALDFLLGALLLALAGAVFWRVSEGLHYQWQWARMPQYLLRFEPQEKRWVANILLHGFVNTIRLSIWGTALAALIGSIAGLGRVARRPLARWVAGTYVALVRNTPPLVLIFIFYFFISDQFLPLLRVPELTTAIPPPAHALLRVLLAPPSKLPAFLSALFTLALFEGAYIAEIVRAGIQSIDRGQWEASAALGFSRFRQLRHVVIPQAVRFILPPLAGQFISTIKDSAIVSVISIQELTFQGLELMAATYMTFEIWITIALLYLTLTFACSLGVTRLEKGLKGPRR